MSSEGRAGGAETALLAGLRLLVTGDAALVCDALGLLLRERGAESVLVAPPEMAVEALGTCTVDVVLLVTVRRWRAVLQLIGRIRQLGRPPAVLVDMLARPSRLVAARKAGAAGYCTCETPLAEVAAGLQRTAAGGWSFPSSSAEPKGDEKGVHPPTLTPRELEIRGMLERGLSVQAIAHCLRLSFRTVEVHKRSLMQKLRCHDVSQLTQLREPDEEGRIT